jgi:hypothetical protein
MTALEKNRAALRALYHRRRAAGECTRCGALAEQGRHACEACRAAVLGERRERYHMLREAGLCVVCKEPAKGALCERHAAIGRRRLRVRNKARLKARYLQRRAAGQCVCCSKGAVEGRSMCAPHLAQARERSRVARDRGRAV